jgi:hypothetical protein
MSFWRKLRKKKNVDFSLSKDYNDSASTKNMNGPKKFNNLRLIIPVLILAIIIFGFAFMYQRERAEENNYYIACRCGCCPEAKPQEKCLYHSKGDDLNKIIDEDKQLAKDPGCAFVGCSFGIKYKYCDKGTTITNTNTNLNSNTNLNKNANTNTSASNIPVESVFDTKIVYGLDWEITEEMIVGLQDDCKKRGGNLNTCGNSCSPATSPEVCSKRCAYICEFTSFQIASQKYCQTESDCVLRTCTGCFSKDYLKTAPADFSCNKYPEHNCQCIKNRCVEVLPSKPYNFPGIFTEESCQAIGAEWVSVGKMMRCEKQAPDAGKPCARSKDCIRYCALEKYSDSIGTCAAHSGSGCYNYLDENGDQGAICVD